MCGIFVSKYASTVKDKMHAFIVQMLKNNVVVVNQILSFLEGNAFWKNLSCEHLKFFGRYQDLTRLSLDQ